MAIELGHFTLILACAIAAVSALAGLWGWNRSERVALLLRQSAILQFLLIAAAFLALIQAFVTSDFSLKLAYEHSHSLQPLLFKITSVWGNHEGSMVLWVLILVLMGAAVALFGRNLPRELLTLVLAMQSLLVAAFGGFTIFTSNPFLRLDPAPVEGLGLNPILQDIGLAIHPPLLYTGYVGFSVCFSFALAALISGRIDAPWARWVRPWALLSWCFLTLGIAMGSYWAYYELGWGGWWFWDPVENASFMPWLAGTALLHSAHGHGKAQRAEDLDDLSVDHHLFAEPARHLHGALGCADLCPQLCDRSDPGPRDPRAARRVHRRRLRLVRVPRFGIAGRRPVLADQPRGRADPQQPVPRHGDRRRARRHALSAAA